MFYQNNNHSIYFLLMVIVSLSSCYAYRPIHEPYTLESRTPPPPIQKKVAEPLSKKEYLEKTFNEIKSTFTEAEVKLIEDSIKVLFPNNIMYAKSSVIPNSNYQEPLQRFAILLKKYYKTNILITGHTDNKGKQAKNREISNQRAQLIKSYISEQGVSISRIFSMGLGDLSPLADNTTEEGRTRNRRVEFVVLYRE